MYGLTPQQLRDIAETIDLLHSRHREDAVISGVEIRADQSGRPLGNILYNPEVAAFEFFPDTSAEGVTR
jgi:hypothetical protein